MKTHLKTRLLVIQSIMMTQNKLHVRESGTSYAYYTFNIRTTRLCPSLGSIGLSVNARLGALAG